MFVHNTGNHLEEILRKVKKSDSEQIYFYKRTAYVDNTYLPIPINKNFNFGSFNWETLTETIIEESSLENIPSHIVYL